MSRLRYMVLYVGMLTTVRADLPTDLQEYAKWEISVLETIQSQTGKPPEEAIPRLGKLVFQLSMETNREKGDRPVFSAAQTALLQIPGHAEYYRDRILAARVRLDQVDRGEDLSPAPFSGMTSFERELSWGMRTLDQLPSPETVRVLGEFLYNERGMERLWEAEKKTGQLDGELIDPVNPPPAISAVAALSRLPLKSKPAPEFRTDDLRTWQLWYQQIKAGNRTFAFKGDPSNYDLNGPVRETKNPDANRSTRRSAAGSSQNTKREKSNTSTVTAIIFAVLIGGGYWIYRRKRVV